MLSRFAKGRNPRLLPEWWVWRVIFATIAQHARNVLIHVARSAAAFANSISESVQAELRDALPCTRTEPTSAYKIPLTPNITTGFILSTCGESRSDQQGR